MASTRSVGPTVEVCCIRPPAKPACCATAPRTSARAFRGKPSGPRGRRSLGLVIITAIWASAIDSSRLRPALRAIIILVSRTASGARAASASAKASVASSSPSSSTTSSDHPKPLRLRRVVDLAEQSHAQRLVEAHGAREQPGSALVRQQADLARRVAEPRAGSGEAEVAGHRQGQAARHRIPSDHSHARLVESAQGHDDGLHAVAHLPALPHRLRGDLAAVFGIAAGDVAAAGAGDARVPAPVTISARSPSSSRKAPMAVCSSRSMTTL